MTALLEDGAPAPLPAGDYAFVELFGHCTVVGRITEVERFGGKFLAVEPLFRDELLRPVLHGAAAIYRLTPCEPEHARKHQPRSAYQLPPSIRAIVPPLLLEAENTFERHEEGEDDERETF